MASDLSSKCRTCLCESSSYHQLFSYVEEKYKILEMLDCVVPQIDVKKTTQFSSIVCHTCVEKLLIGYKFQQSCIETHNRLHDLLGITVFETQSKTEQILDPLAAESNLIMKEEKYDVDFDTQKEGADVGNVSNNRFPDDSDTKTLERNRRKGTVPCTECGKVFSNLNRLKQHKTKHDKQQDVKEPDLTTTILDEKINDIEKSLSAVVKQEKELTPPRALWLDNPLLQADYKNSGDNSEDRLLSKSEDSKINTADVVAAVDDKESNKRKDDDYPCEICGKIFDREQRLKRHRVIHSRANSYSLSRPDPFECPDCLRRFKQKGALAAHRQTHVRDTLDINYPCTLCQRTFMSIILLTEHITNKHPEVERHKCDQCDKTFVLHAHLVEHLNRHKGIKNVVCLICEKEFGHNNTLKEHMRTHSGESPYLCPQCGKTFRSASNLRQHIERHTGLKKYQCPECPGRFNCRSDLIKHTSTHSNSKPHVCDICGSSFTRAYALRKHKLLHSGERPFKCEQCNMTFAVIYHLRRHMRTHTGEKPYKCKYCEKAYAESGYLTQHLRTHVGENTYNCDQCSMAFKYVAELRQHQLQHYKMAQKLLQQAQKMSEDTKQEINEQQDQQNLQQQQPAKVPEE